jgi:hypothetical protein
LGPSLQMIYWVTFLQIFVLGNDGGILLGFWYKK